MMLIRYNLEILRLPPQNDIRTKSYRQDFKIMNAIMRRLGQ